MVGGWWSYCLWMCNFTSLEKHPSKSPAWTVGCIGPRAPTYIPVRKCCLAHWDGKMASRWQTEKGAKLPGLCWLWKKPWHHANVYRRLRMWHPCGIYPGGSQHAGNTIVPHLHSVPVALENAPRATAGHQHGIRSTLTDLSIKSGFTTCIFSSRSRLPPRDMKIFVIICYPSKQTSCI